MDAIVNLPDIMKLTEEDAVIKSINELYGPPKNWSRPIGFDSMTRIILEQQLSLAAAKAHYNKLVEYTKTLSPERILKLTAEEFRDCYISRQKASYLKNLAALIVDGSIDFEDLATQKDTLVRKSLTNIIGIGNWTVDVYLLLCHQSKDIMPLGDVTIKTTIRELYLPYENVELQSLSKKWKPLRSLATFYFWHYYLTKRNRPLLF